jgi:hypothetical protein
MIIPNERSCAEESMGINPPQWKDKMDMLIVVAA